MVLFIVLLHAACAYAFSIPWWHARDALSQGFDLLIFCMDVFALPVLFFVSGLFAEPSRERHGRGGLLKGKLRRLGVPLLLLPVFYLPAMVYVGYLRRVADPAPFFDYWLHWVGTMGDWNFVLLTTMETGAKYLDACSPHHLWFIFMLLVFFAGYALCRPWFRGAGARRVTLPAMAVAWLLLAAGYAGGNLLIQDWAWARLGPFILFQPARVPLYLGAFLFGIYARPHVARRESLPGSPYLWIPLFPVLFITLLLTTGKDVPTSPASLPEAVIWGLLRAGLLLSATCMAVNGGYRFLRSASPWQRSLSASSYDTYLLHMPLVVFAQAGLLDVALPTLLKMGLAFLVPAGLCWGLSRQVLARSPSAVSLVLLLAFFAGFCLLF
jgi:hypothetical protein